MRLYYVTFPDREEQERITEKAVDQRLATCVNAFSINSCYRWQGDVEQDEEVVAMFKTADDRGADLEAFILEEHPYEVPCIMELPVSANQGYEDWIESESR